MLALGFVFFVTLGQLSEEHLRGLRRVLPNEHECTALSKAVSQHPDEMSAADNFLLR